MKVSHKNMSKRSYGKKVKISERRFDENFAWAYNVIFELRDYLEKSGSSIAAFRVGELEERLDYSYDTAKRNLEISRVETANQ
jgi:hypothetical protein